MHYKIIIRAPHQGEMASAWINEFHKDFLRRNEDSKPQPYTYESHIAPFNAEGEDWCIDYRTSVAIDIYDDETKQKRLDYFIAHLERISAQEVPKKVTRLLRVLKSDSLRRKKAAA